MMIKEKIKWSVPRVEEEENVYGYIWWRIQEGKVVLTNLFKHIKAVLMLTRHVKPKERTTEEK
jgi:hypothetical protein